MTIWSRVGAIGFVEFETPAMEEFKTGRATGGAWATMTVMVYVLQRVFKMREAARPLGWRKRGD